MKNQISVVVFVVADHHPLDFPQMVGTFMPILIMRVQGIAVPLDNEILDINRSPHLLL
jgi:hypothetical protein